MGLQGQVLVSTCRVGLSDAPKGPQKRGRALGGKREKTKREENDVPVGGQRRRGPHRPNDHDRLVAHECSVKEIPRLLESVCTLFPPVTAQGGGG